VLVTSLVLALAGDVAVRIATPTPSPPPTTGGTPTPSPTPTFSGLPTATPVPLQTSDPNIDPFFPPIDYDWPWWLVLPLFIALVVAWILLSKRFAAMRGFRRRTGPIPAVPRMLPLPVDVRRKAFARIDDVERRVNSGDLTPRDAHIELSEILRELAFYTTRFDARSMTLAELRAAGLARLADTVSQFYPIAFEPGEAVDAGPAIAAARTAVSQWV
jgi:hypothetical protein